MERKFVKAVFIEKKDDRAIIEVDSVRSEFLLAVDYYGDETLQVWVSCKDNMYLVINSSENGDMIASELMQSEIVSYEELDTCLTYNCEDYFVLTEIKNNSLEDSRYVEFLRGCDIRFIVDSFRSRCDWFVEQDAGIVRFKTHFDSDLYLIKNKDSMFFLEGI